MSKLNILVLHKMGLPQLRRQAVIDLEYMLPNYAGEHNYIVHDCDLPLPDFIKDINFDAIVLGPTFLCNRFSDNGLKIAMSIYDFIRESDACKIAMPQDDYNFSEILDKWMVTWNIDILFSVLPKFVDILYPDFLKNGGVIKKAYTGYISDDIIKKWKITKKFQDRKIDVSYRTTFPLASIGEVGYIKGAIANRFQNAVEKYSLVLDISTERKHMIPGNRWHDFLEDSKFCLASNSGSSLLDKTGKYRKAVIAFTSRYPNATFEEIRNTCFPNEDNKYIMTALSPRNIEAILAGTVQIAVPGEYSGILNANDHYIPLEPSCKNIDNVISMMNDTSFVLKMARNSKEAILDTKELYYKNHVDNIISLIRNCITKKNTNRISYEKFQKFQKLYEEYQLSVEKTVWRKKIMVNILKVYGKKIGLKRLVDILKYH